MRSLGILRISKLTKESTSLARQREIITAANRGEIIDWAEDPDVSASKYPPTQRPELAPWLTDPEKIEQYDEILFWRMDRFLRSPADFADMYRWCEKHGKNLRSATESFDLSEPMGRAMAYIICIFAEMETAAISTRVTGAHKYLRENGRWQGGVVPYGRRPVPLDKGWGLVEDPESVQTIRWMVEEVLQGATVNSLVTRLHAQGVPAPDDWRRDLRGAERQGDSWHVSTIQKILRSPNMVGWTTHQGKVVLGSDGMPVQRTSPIVDIETWERVKAALSQRGQDHPIYRTNANPLLGVAKCRACGLNYTRRSFQKKRRGEPYGKQYEYYCCAGVAKGTCKAPQLACSEVEAAVEDAFLTRWGQSQRLERRWVVGQDTPEELAGALYALETLVSRLAQTDSPAVARTYERQMTELEARIAELEAKPARLSGWELVDTGETWGEAWARSEWSERRQMLLKAGLEAVVGKSAGIFVVEFSAAGTLEA